MGSSGGEGSKRECFKGKMHMGLKRQLIFAKTEKTRKTPITSTRLETILLFALHFYFK